MWDKLTDIFNKPDWLLTQEEQFIMFLIFYVILPVFTFAIFTLWIVLEIKFERWRIKWISKQLQKKKGKTKK